MFACPYTVTQSAEVVLEYDGMPHTMGAAAIPSFLHRPLRGGVAFSSHYERYNEIDGLEADQWEYLTLPTIGNSFASRVKYNEKKTKRKKLTRTIVSNEIPVENDRTSTIAMFPSRVFANFLKLQIDASNALEEHYIRISEPDANYDGWLHGEGGTLEDAGWGFGVEHC